MENRKVYIIILVASFGYFVDAVDLIVASLVRAESIISLGLHSDTALLSSLGIDLSSLRADVTERLTSLGQELSSELVDAGVQSSVVKLIGLELEKWQTWGLLLGGIMFGILGDRIGRTKALYGSIFLYSISTLLNGLLQPNWGNTYLLYCSFRFLSGFGLAAEMGAAITLVSETMKKGKRGIGSAYVASIGLLGCVFAAGLIQFADLNWRYLFIIGGVLGLVLLLLRTQTEESPIYNAQKSSSIKRGDFISLFTKWDRFKRLLICVTIGLPTYYVIGLPTKFAANFANELNIEGLSFPIIIMTFYIAMSLSDIVCNTLSQILRSRKKMFFIYNSFSLIAVLVFTIYPPQSAWQYHYVYCPMLGLSIGYWALLITTASESFGTNLRATVTTVVPNFIRSTFIPIAYLFGILNTYFNSLLAGGVIGVICSVIAIVATTQLKETFGRDLNFVEK